MTIVCATHFSDTSFRAVRVAAGLAHKHRQPLWLVTVLPARHIDDGAEHAVNDALLLEAAALAGDGIETFTAVLHGPLERAVGHFCAEKNALLLVVGDSSRETNPLFAGTLDKFAYAVELPLLVVRDPAPLEEWIKGTDPLRVMLALDHTWSSAVARDWITRLAEYGPLDLVAAHVWWPPGEFRRRGLQASAEGLAAVAGLIHHETDAALAGLPSNVRHRVHLEQGRGQIGLQLLGLAANEHVDVLVLGTNPHHGPISLLRSVSHQVLTGAPMSVACIPSRLLLHGVELPPEPWSVSH